MVYFLCMKSLDPAYEQFATLANDLGWRLAKEAPSGDDFEIVTRGGLRWSVELKALAAARTEQLTAALAAAALQARRHAGPDARPLALVYVPRLSAGMLQRLERYALEYLGDTAWGAFDSLGRMRCPALGVDQAAAHERSLIPQRRLAAERGASSPINPFTDLGQWLLKVAFAAKIPADWLQAPRGRMLNQRQFAQLAGVSPPTVTRWIKGFENLGLLQPGARKLQPGPLGLVLKRWARAANAPPPLHEVQVVSVAAHSPEKALASLLDKAPDAVLCRDSACQALGVSIVSGALPSVYLSDRSARAIERFGLRPTLAGERPGLTLVEPRFPQSIARGAVETSAGRCTDILQCYLDLLDHPARGREQADAIKARLKGLVSW